MLCALAILPAFPLRWKGARKDMPLSKQERDQLMDVIVVLRGNRVPDQTLAQVWERQRGSV